MARYLIVPERSRVWIDARSNVHPIHSTTDGLEGHIEVDMDPDGHVAPGGPATGRLSLRVSRLSSGNGFEDREMQRRTDARRFPLIEGVLDRIDSADADGHYDVSGDVSFRGVVRRMQDQMTIEVVDPATIRLAGSARFDIRDFGMQPPRILMLKVEPQVDVRVEILAVKEA
jgi:YceI-like domain